MPTANRRQFIPQAIDSFLSQTWENKELVILDDGEDLVADLVPEDERVRYAVAAGKMNIPAKRNMINGLANGAVIMHWDDDDWSAPERMGQQVKQLETSGKQMVGYHSLGFWDVESERAYWYQGSEHVYACGTSMCYWKTFWELNQFDESIDLSSDNWFSRAARIRNELWTCSAEKMMVARVHPGTSNPKQLKGNDSFKPLPNETLNKRFLKCLLAA
jgi:glycosyltransferase involved in cell wall biosynthesis